MAAVLLDGFVMRFLIQVLWQELIFTDSIAVLELEQVFGEGGFPFLTEVVIAVVSIYGGDGEDDPLFVLLQVCEVVFGQHGE